MKNTFLRFYRFSRSLNLATIIFMCLISLLLFNSGNTLLREHENRKILRIDANSLDSLGTFSLPVYAEVAGIVIKENSPFSFEYKFVEEDFIDYLASFILGHDSLYYLKNILYPAYASTDTIRTFLGENRPALMVIIDDTDAKKKIQPLQFQYMVKYDTVIKGKIEALSESVALDTLRGVGVNISPNTLIIYKNEAPLSPFITYLFLFLIAIALTILCASILCSVYAFCISIIQKALNLKK
ncbi:MAG: hypothetical protein DYG98_21765 [Haliscomenobacteraceae bacterium CHB4]|nr:hypothetical protein [Haliscomenobacteraceae bacterium CHB4]